MNNNSIGGGILPNIQNIKQIRERIQGLKGEPNFGQMRGEIAQRLKANNPEGAVHLNNIQGLLQDAGYQKGNVQKGDFAEIQDIVLGYFQEKGIERPADVNPRAMLRDRFKNNFAALGPSSIPDFENSNPNTDLIKILFKSKEETV